MTLTPHTSTRVTSRIRLQSKAANQGKDKTKTKKRVAAAKQPITGKESKPTLGKCQTNKYTHRRPPTFLPDLLVQEPRQPSLTPVSLTCTVPSEEAEATECELSTMHRSSKRPPCLEYVALDWGLTV